MKLRNKKTGEICELGHIRQAWREEKDGGMGYMFLKADDNNGIIYNSLAEMMDEWEDYKPKEPLIKDENKRKIIRACANLDSVKDVKVLKRYSSNTTTLIFDKTTLILKGVNEYDCLQQCGTYTINELCGEEEE